MKLSENRGKKRVKRKRAAAETDRPRKRVKREDSMDFSDEDSDSSHEGSLMSRVADSRKAKEKTGKLKGKENPKATKGAKSGRILRRQRKKLPKHGRIPRRQRKKLPKYGRILRRQRKKLLRRQRKKLPKYGRIPDQNPYSTNQQKRLQLNNRKQRNRLKQKPRNPTNRNRNKKVFAAFSVPENRILMSYDVIETE